MCPNKTFGFTELWGNPEVTGKSYYSLLARIVIHMLITRKPFSFLGLLCVCARILLGFTCCVQKIVPIAVQTHLNFGVCWNSSLLCEWLFTKLLNIL